MYQVRVTAESAPRGHAFWTLDARFNNTFNTLAEAEAYVEKIDELQSQEDRDDEYYDLLGPIIQIVEVE